MKILLIFSVLFITAFSLNAQDENPNGNDTVIDKSEFFNVKYKIVQMEQSYNSDINKFNELILQHKIIVGVNGKLRLQIENRNELGFSKEDLSYLNIEMDNGNDRVQNVYVHPTDLKRIFGLLKENHILSFSEYESTNQGPSLMNSNTYRDHSSGNANGQGVKIAIVDSGFDMLTEAANAGVVPPIGTITAYTHGTGPVQSDGVHGTACLETVYDHAPSATYYIHKTASYADIQDAIDDCIADDVDIISHSKAWFNSAWDDNDGDIADAFKDASDAGIMIFTAAGNYADQEHDRQNVWTDNDNDDFFNWTATDEGNTFTVTNNCAFSVSLSWEGDPDPVFDNFDLYLYDAFGILNDISSGTNTYETVSANNTSGGNKSYYVSVKNEGSDLNDFKLFFRSSDCGTTFQYSTPENSMTHPAISTHTEIYTVGAVYRTDYNAASTDPIVNYSSQGPSTSGGSIKPDLVAPTGTTTLVYGGDFNGTSCSTPNAAGAAACMMSGHPTLSGNEVYTLMKRKATRYLDWGTSGDDNVYGHGGIFLLDYDPDNIYVHSGDGTDNVVPSNGVYPWHNVEDYDNSGAAGKNVIFLTDDTTSPAVVLNKPMFLSTLKYGTSSKDIK